MPPLTNPVSGDPIWFDLVTPDVEKAKAFYQKMFGWEYTTGGADTMHYTMAFVPSKVAKQPAAGIGQLPKDAPYPTAWTVYFATDDADRSAVMVRELGGKVTMGPHDVTTEGRMLIATDSVGAAFGLWQPKNHKGTNVKHEPGAMTWTEGYTTDLARSGNFYGRLLGLTPKEMTGMNYTTLNRDDLMMAGLMGITPDMGPVPPHWIPYFSVASADKSVVLVEELGGKVLVPPKDIPYGRFAIVQDPFGATLGILQNAGS